MKKKDLGYLKIPQVRDLKEMILRSGKLYSERAAFAYSGKYGTVQKTYAELLDNVFSLGSYFYSLGLKGAKIALYAENSYEWIVTYFAAVCGSNIIVPIDKELKAPEAAVLIRDCNADMIVYSKKKESILDEFEEGELKAALCIDDFDSAYKKGGEDTTEYAENQIDPEACCSIIYTSGTTGKPKGVMLCQRNIISDTIRSLETLPFPNGTPDNPIGTLLLLPLNHTFGFTACIATQLHSGVCIYINSGLKYILQDFKIAKPGHVSVVPLFIENFYKGIWRNAKKEGKDKLLKNMIKFSNALRKIGIDIRRKLFKSVIDSFGGNLEMIVSGGAPIAEELVDGFADFGIRVINGYGISECSPIVSMNRHCISKKGSVGQTIHTVQAKTINDNEDGEGEICIKGDIVMLGYYNNEKANEEAFTQDGWFKTGDIGRVDEDSFIFLTGRKKNLIILENGKNVYPEELEYLIGKIEGVLEVIVYAENGVITAEIFPDENADKDKIEADIKNVLNPTIAQYKRINAVKFRDTEFEKTTTRKIKR